MKRENNYDLLRVISAIAVITIHVSDYYLEDIICVDRMGKLYTGSAFITCLYNTLSRFAVPCFIMLSGAFALDKEKNSEFRYYYCKIFKSTGISTIIVSILYFIYSFLIEIIAVVVNGEGLTILLKPIRRVITGAPFYHLWYLYMMIGIFILTPIVIRVKNDLGEKCFARVTMMFFPLAMVSLWTSIHELNWDLGVSFCYLGYYMLGYIIRKKFSKHKNNVFACTVIGSSFLLMIGIAYFKYQQSTMILADDAPYSPFMVLASVLIFIGFTSLDIKRVFNKTATITFEIYLFHAGIWDVIKRIAKMNMDSRIMIPFSIILVLLLSVFISVLYRKIWREIDKKWGITDKTIKMLSLVSF